MSSAEESTTTSALGATAGGQTPYPMDQVTPRAKQAMRIIGAVTVFMVVLAFVFCLVRGSTVNPTYYLLACNLIISSFVGLVNAWWYRSGTLSIEKHWYIILVCLVIIIQCITTDVYVFHHQPAGKPPTPSTTASPHDNLTTHTVPPTRK